MIVIGHRGAAGIEPENTIPSIEAAVACGVDMIEFDLRVTKDKQLVVIHDQNLYRIAGVNKNVADMTLDEISTTVTYSGHPIPTFTEAMEAAHKTPVLLDCKGKGWAALLDKSLQDHLGPRPMVTAIDTQEMFRFAELRPDIETYVSELTKPFEAVYRARLLGFTGVSLNFWVMNPLAYHYSKRHGQKFMIFTVNRAFLARFLHFLYPTAMIITNYPDKLMPIRNRLRKKRKPTK